MARRHQDTVGDLMCGITGCLALSLEADPDQEWVRTATERLSQSPLLR